MKKLLSVVLLLSCIGMQAMDKQEDYDKEVTVRTFNEEFIETMESADDSILKECFYEVPQPDTTTTRTFSGTLAFALYVTSCKSGVPMRATFYAGTFRMKIESWAYTKEMFASAKKDLATAGFKHLSRKEQFAYACKLLQAPGGNRTQ